MSKASETPDNSLDPNEGVSEHLMSMASQVMTSLATDWRPGGQLNRQHVGVAVIRGDSWHRVVVFEVPSACLCCPMHIAMAAGKIALSLSDAVVAIGHVGAAEAREEGKNKGDSVYSLTLVDDSGAVGALAVSQGGRVRWDAGRVGVASGGLVDALRRELVGRSSSTVH